MARAKGNKKDVIMKAVKAFGGGVVAEFVSDTVAKQAPDFVQENPEITELVPAAGGLALLYFMPGKLDEVALGMIGASGAGMSDRLLGGMQGFNRLTMQGTEAEELQRGREFVEELINQGNASAVNPMGGYDTGSGDGMSNY